MRELTYKNIHFKTIPKRFFLFLGASIHKQGRASIAKCVAALVITQSPNEIQTVVSQFASYLKPNDASTAHQQTFSLLVIGEIGKHT